MNDDGLPTEDQLRRLEQRVMTRIRRRAELPKRIATGAAVAALFAGGVFLLPRLGATGGGAGSSSGSGGGTAYRTSESGRAAGSAALLAQCHAASSSVTPGRSVPLTEDTATAALKACVAAFENGQVPKATDGSGTSTNQLVGPPTAKDLVVCRDAAGRLQVLVKDAHPSTLCTRDGLRTP